MSSALLLSYLVDGWWSCRRSEKHERAFFYNLSRLKDANDNTHALLKRILPEEAIASLRSRALPGVADKEASPLAIAKSHPSVTVLFSDFESFPKFLQQCEPVCCALICPLSCELTVSVGAD